MFGYVVTFPGEMKVKEDRLYKAIYCGLCKETKKVSIFLLPLLNYDFTFLATLRMAANKTKIEIGKKRCSVHVLKKRPFVKSNPELRFTAVCHLILTFLKMQDDIRDPDISKIKKFFIRIYAFFIGRAVKKHSKNEEYKTLFSEISRIIRNGTELEKQNASLDEMCSNFAKVMSIIASSGFDGENKRILERIGEMLGRYLYTLDAADDVFSDEKSGSFNPFINEYKSAALFAENIEKTDMVLSLYALDMKNSFDLLETDDILSGIVNNIIESGLKFSFKKICERIGELNERPV